MAKKKTETAPTGDRIQLSVFAVAIAGGKVLPGGEQGPLDTDEDPTNPLFDERLKSVSMSPEWVQSFIDHGVMTDIEVTYVGGVATVVDGRERIRGARLASRQLNKQLAVWCKVVTLTGNDLLLRGLLLNLHHADPVPVKIAKAKRATEAGLTEEQIAPAMGVTPATIKVWMTWDKRAIQEVKDAVMDGRISAVTGFDIGRLKKDDQLPALQAVLAIGKRKKATPSGDEGAGGEEDGDGGAQTRDGSRTAEQRAIRKATGQRPVVAGKKGMKALLRVIQEFKLPKKADERLIGAVAGFEELLQLLLGIASPSEEGKMLDAFVAATQMTQPPPSTPTAEDEDEEVPEGTPPPAPKKAKKQASPPPAPEPAPVEPPKETVRQRAIREAAEKKAAAAKK